MNEPRTEPGAANPQFPGSVGDVRRGNLARVLGTVARANAELHPTRAQIAAQTGLTKASVSSLVAELIEQGLLVEIGQHRDGDRGRPGVGLGLSPTRCVLGMEVNVDYISAGLVDLCGQPVHREVRQRDNRGSSPAGVMDALEDLVAGQRRLAEDQGLTILGGALALPGLVDSGSNTVLHAPNLGWEGVQLDLEPLLPKASMGVALFNEANAAALAHRQLVTSGAGDYLFVSGEVGIGGALVVGSELFAGPRGNAGEIGHVVVQPGGLHCSCGGRGCLETVAGQDAIYRAAGLDAPAPGARGNGPTPAGQRHIAMHLRAALEAGDQQALSAVKSAGYYLGVALASAAQLTDLSSVVLGGHFAALGEWIVPTVQESAAQHAPRTTAPITITLSPLGHAAALIGAAQSVVRQLLENPPLTARG